ncbi:TPA: DUF1327 domain-containing protein [Citrobacter freundii]|uniref:DUF1327 domain-containing protein n=1 Tax=Citrobacter freundii complex TaxID=1344959 RepID=UPI0009AC7596|nr:MULTISPECIES: DUF1327 domain-containing protein [Citrobacter freundii complex]HCB1524081.1 DUF1327 domain-containing protein [Citrobacter braakii]EKU3697914.1 DUF1327 domain-containing protein [Citrobacter freundii]MBJ8914056.1 DUF1327 domain-containing protein [Citrobacter freundii]OPW92509.1 hypothetical protein BZK40_12155 [Citrobacter portucalensis]QFI10846.1 DUF1327 domain-containing protein [Citrobacter freundii]
MNLEKQVEILDINKYDLTVKSLYLAGQSVSVVLEVHSSRMTTVPLFSMDIEVERKKDASLSYYESEAIKKAASLIHNIADKLSVTA